MDAKINLLERNIIKILEREEEGKMMYEMEEERLKKELAELKEKYEKLIEYIKKGYKYNIPYI